MRKNLPLIIGIALPVVFIVIIALAVILPPMSIHPTHDLIYTLDNNDMPEMGHVYKNNYSIVGDKLVMTPVAMPSAGLPGSPSLVATDAPTLYRYDVARDASYEISFADAEKLDLVPGPSSPEGYTVSFRAGNGDIFDLFGGSGNNAGYYISNAHASRRLSGLVADDPYNSRVIVVGWVR